VNATSTCQDLGRDGNPNRDPPSPALSAGGNAPAVCRGRSGRRRVVRGAGGGVGGRPGAQTLTLTYTSWHLTQGGKLTRPGSTSTHRFSAFRWWPPVVVCVAGRADAGAGPGATGPAGRIDRRGWAAGTCWSATVWDDRHGWCPPTWTRSTVRSTSSSPGSSGIGFLAGAGPPGSRPRPAASWRCSPPTRGSRRRPAPSPTRGRRPRIRVRPETEPSEAETHLIVRAPSVSARVDVRPRVESHAGQAGIASSVSRAGGHLCADGGRLPRSAASRTRFRCCSSRVCARRGQCRVRPDADVRLRGCWPAVAIARRGAGRHSVRDVLVAAVSRRSSPAPATARTWHLTGTVDRGRPCSRAPSLVLARTAGGAPASTTGLTSIRASPDRTATGNWPEGRRPGVNRWIK